MEPYRCCRQVRRCNADRSVGTSWLLHSDRTQCHLAFY